MSSLKLLRLPQDQQNLLPGNGRGDSPEVVSSSPQGVSKLRYISHCSVLPVLGGSLWCKNERYDCGESLGASLHPASPVQVLYLSARAPSVVSAEIAAPWIIHDGICRLQRCVYTEDELTLRHSGTNERLSLLSVHSAGTHTHVYTHTYVVHTWSCTHNTHTCSNAQGGHSCLIY